ncbi:MAG: ParB/RepB/Spo0J family partition protein [Candidatus Bathyarchaeia archaeon]
MSVNKVRVDLNKLVPSPYSANKMSEEEFQKIVNAVREHGESALETVIVAPAPKRFWGKEVENPATGDRVFCDRDSYIVVSGWHRVLAAKKAGLKSIEAQVRNLSVEEIREWTFRYNLKGKNVGVIVFEQVKQMLNDMDAVKVAEIVGIDVRTVKAVGKAGNLHPKIRERILCLPDPTVVTVDNCIDIASFETLDYQNRVLDIILSGGGNVRQIVSRLLAAEEAEKRLNNVDDMTKKVVATKHDRGTVVSSYLLSSLLNFPQWMREDLVERLAGNKDYLVAAKIQETADEIARERSQLISSLPEPLKKVVDKHMDFLGIKHIIAVKSVDDLNLATTLLNEIVAKNLTGDEAQALAKSMASNVVRETKTFPLSSTQEVYDLLFECPYCKRDLELKAVIKLKPSHFVELTVREYAGEYVVERTVSADKSEEIVELNGVRLKVNYEEKTVEQVV